MNKNVLIHVFWALAALVSFVVGSQLFPAKSSNNEGQTADSRMGTRSGSKSSLGGGGGVNPSNRSGGTDILAQLKPGKGTPLSALEIERLGEQLRSSSNPIERRLAFSKMLEGMTAENALEVREQIAELPGHSAEFREFHYAWGAIAGIDAIMFGADTEKPDMSPALAGWAGANPQEAIKWFQSLNMENDSRFDDLLKDRKVPVEELRNHLLDGLVGGLADADPHLASEFVLALNKEGNKHSHRLIHTVIGSVLRGDPSDAIAWGESLPEGDMRNSALGRIAGHLAGQNLEEAVEWAANYADKPEGGRIVQEVVGRWAHRKPEEALQWVESLPEGAGKERGLHSTFSAWAGRNPEEAGNYIHQMSKSPERDSAISGYALRVMHEDPARGVEWASSISDPSNRERTLIRAAQHYMHRDRGAAQQWLATSGLSEEAKQSVLNPRHRHR